MELLDSLNADFVVHGGITHMLAILIHADDIPVNSEGVSAYDSVIKAGRCKIIKRTEGISTTNLVGRLLMHYREGTSVYSLLTPQITSLPSSSTRTLTTSKQ